jgi:hypothetical protein
MEVTKEVFLLTQRLNCFDSLISWLVHERVESGLLKPDPAKGKGARGKGNAELLAKQEKAQEKKEKVRYL